MSRWKPGEAEIEQLLAAGHLQKVTGGRLNGEQLLQKARRTLQTAAVVAAADPENAYVLAYDATRYACTALLAQQGLRPTTSGGHYALEQAVRAQFGAGFRSFGAMRRRRNELEYPTAAEEHADQDEAKRTIDAAHGLIDAAGQLFTSLPLF